MNKEGYEKRIGYAPEQDDLERINCKKAGEVGHSNCGWCKEHDKPRFMCGCEKVQQPRRETGITME